MKSIAINFVAAHALIYWSKSAFAHEGHGMGSSHWHASDVWGFVALGGAIAVAVWLSRGGK
jgi:hypothetical protein